MDKVLASLIPVLVNLLLKVLTPAMIEKNADKVLDILEAAIAKSESKYDDEVMLPLIALLRETFHIEDNDKAAA